jgi:amidophosphoribosyltransferase
MGVDMATYNELIAYRMDVEAICAHIGADSLKYLSLEGLLSVVDDTSTPNEAHHCNACFSGCYPIPIPDWLFSNQRDKNIFEQVWGKES